VGAAAVEEAGEVVEAAALAVVEEAAGAVVEAAAVAVVEEAAVTTMGQCRPQRA
jgi:hypothetical protein